MQNGLGSLERKETAVPGLATNEAAQRPVPDVTIGPTVAHRVIVVGGGAGGLELVTGLGNRLGRPGKAEVTLVEKARTHLWKPLLHEIAAGSMDLDDHALDYLAQAHWHHFRYRIGEMVGLDRTAKNVLLGATHDEDGRLVTPARAVPYDILVL